MGALCFLLVLLLGLQPRWAEAQAAARPQADGARTKLWVERQCATGPRVVGSPGHRATKRLILDALRQAGLDPRTQEFRVLEPASGDSVTACNIVAAVRPGVRPRLLLGAHWDTRPWSDREREVAKRAQPVLGANDGGSGTAVLLHLAELMSKQAPPIGVDLAFFDAEDLGTDDAPGEFCLGSQYMASRWSGPPPDWALVLDMVGAKGSVFPREEYASEVAPDWSRLLFDLAAEAGYSDWNDDVSYAIVDDHISFLRLGVPAALWIGWGDPAWHTTRDLPDRIDPALLGRVSDLVLRLIYGGYLHAE